MRMTTGLLRMLSRIIERLSASVFWSMASSPANGPSATVTFSPAEDKGFQSLWSIEHDVPKISRALFSRHFEHIYWKPAVESMLNFMSGQRAEPELADILAIDADNFISISKGRSAQLYSTLSKGVHWEFFTSALLFDEITVKSAIRDTYVLISHLGLVSHFIPTAYASLDPNDAVDTYILFRKLVP